MRAVAQRVSSAQVEVEGEIIGRIGRGLLVYLGAGKDDADGVADWMAGKLVGHSERDLDGVLGEAANPAHRERVELRTLARAHGFVSQHGGICHQITLK